MLEEAKIILLTLILTTHFLWKVSTKSVLLKRELFWKQTFFTSSNIKNINELTILLFLKQSENTRVFMEIPSYVCFKMRGNYFNSH